MTPTIALALSCVVPLFAACAVELDDPDLAPEARNPRTDIFLAADGDDARPCTADAPCRRFDRANELLRADGGSRIILRRGYYADTIVLDHGATVVGNGSWIYPPGDDARVVLEAGDGPVVVHDLTIYVAHREEIRCGDGGITLEDVATNAPILCIVAGRNEVRLRRVAASGGLVVAKGEVEIERSRFVGGHGVWLWRAAYDITNSVFARNSAGLRFDGPIAGDRPQRFAHNTVIDNGSPTWAEGTLGVECRNGAYARMTGNLVWTTWQPQFGVVVSRGCAHSDDSWVWSYAAPNPDPGLTDDYHLRADSPLVDAGELLAEDGVDLDGDLRRAGTVADIGADEWVP